MRPIRFLLPHDLLELTNQHRGFLHASKGRPRAFLAFERFRIHVPKGRMHAERSLFDYVRRKCRDGEKTERSNGSVSCARCLPLFLPNLFQNLSSLPSRTVSSERKAHVSTFRKEGRDVSWLKQRISSQPSRSVLEIFIHPIHPSVDLPRHRRCLARKTWIERKTEESFAYLRSG